MERRRITFWWPLTNALVDFLNEQTAEEGTPLFDGVPIYPGTKGTAKKDYPCIEISYDDEGQIDFAQLYKGKLHLWIDVWVKSHSSTPSDAFQMQDDLQEKLLACLVDFPDYIREHLGVATHLVIEQIISDGEIYRPTMAARIVLGIEWRIERR